ncbi:Cof-type HAD-IIB family hydrolase [Sporosarcina sp. YIM B06819]|uniref:Cof-type HAD-IIB family hydrolase n=1 Tax=Sporosarcina sp. YIM B06819 TaxID=3081769 RepID=UPI00298CA82E|nr:Cof-type HAD-IIB family hydrolase [Sporosarcina sp. YIM B06819]
MYKLIAIDLDGTLLTDELTITPRTIQAIQKAVELGTVVTIATGRMYPSAKQFAQQLGIQVPVITYQGAIIKNIADDEVLYERLIPADIAQQLVNIAKERNLHLQVYQDDILYGAVENDKLIAYAEKSKVPYQIEPDFSKLTNQGFTKVIFIEEPEILDTLQDEICTLFGERAHVAKSFVNYLEVTHPEANKGSALLHLASKLGIDRTETIGIGDNHNDVELIEAAGLGIAMGNGVQALKEIADYTSLSNNEDGVGHAIEKFVLEPVGAMIE